MENLQVNAKEKALRNKTSAGFYTGHTSSYQNFPKQAKIQNYHTNRG